jgi:hydroxyquinol 1,2-dioxygenase
VKSSLITLFERHEPGVAPDGKRMETPFYTARYDFTLAQSEG